LIQDPAPPPITSLEAFVDYRHRSCVGLARAIPGQGSLGRMSLAKWERRLARRQFQTQVTKFTVHATGART
jgi:hypothetical protein